MLCIVLASQCDSHDSWPCTVGIGLGGDTTFFVLLNCFFDWKILGDLAHFSSGQCNSSHHSRLV